MTATRQAELTRGSVESGGDPRPLSIPRPTLTVQTLLVGSGLALLLGVTACAVASVSGWLVPVYLLVVLAILAAPRGGRSPAKGRGAEAGEPSPASGPVPEPDDPQAGESVDGQSASLRADPAAAAFPRPRRTRSRARKAVKTADPAAEPAPVTWIRVGPGQYVRSDSLSQGQGEPPAAEAPAPPVEGPADALEVEPSPAPAEEPAPAPTVALDQIPAVEEDGIAPAPFDTVSSVVRGPWSVVELKLTAPRAQAPSRRGPALRSRSRPRRPRPLTTGNGRRATARPRAEVRGQCASEPRRADAARRAFARTPHVRRDSRRARSPPVSRG